MVVVSNSFRLYKYYIKYLHGSMMMAKRPSFFVLKLSAHKNNLSVTMDTVWQKETKSPLSEVEKDIASESDIKTLDSV